MRDGVRRVARQTEVTPLQMSSVRCRGRMRMVTVLVMQTDTLFWESLLFEGINDGEAEAVSTSTFGMVEVVATGRAGGPPCLGRGRFSGRVHDRYEHRLRDLSVINALNDPKPRPSEGAARRRLHTELHTEPFLEGACASGQGRLRARRCSGPSSGAATGSSGR